MENQGVLTTYKAILRGNYLEWPNDVQTHLAPERAVAVYVTILDEPVTPAIEGESQGQRMAAALEQLAQLPSRTTIADPVTWERQMRQERTLPGRKV